MTAQHEHGPQLFIVRLWPERVDRNRIEWRGEIRHVPSGEVRYFHRWYTLVSFIVEVLDDEGQR